jgi:UDP-3-O-[3-hydroxymyristoyl] N-acetylglucosamine deacetylase
VIPTHLSSALSQGEASIQTPEHSLAALAGLGIDNCRIEVNGPEMPILDGSALPFVEALLSAGIRVQEAPRAFAVISEPITVYNQDAFVSAIPSSGLRLTYGIDFPDSPIQQQWYSWTLQAGVFVTAVAPARTFTREQDIERARQQGLIKGGSLENAIVCTEKSWHTPLRFPDEPVRHKLIDLLGDLSLLGVRLQGHILAYKAGHRLHHELSQHLAQQLGLSSSISQDH